MSITVKFQRTIFADHEYDFNEDDYIWSVNADVVLKQGKVEISMPLYLLEEVSKFLNKDYENFSVRTYHGQGALWSLRTTCCGFFELIIILGNKMIRVFDKDYQKLVKRINKCIKLCEQDAHAVYKLVDSGNFKELSKVKCRTVVRYYDADGNFLKKL